MTAPAPVRTRDGWRAARLLLAVVWAVLLLTALLLREDESSLSQLYADVRAGQVERVELVGGLDAFDRELPPERRAARSGQAQLEVRWGGLGRRRVASVLEVAGTQPASASDGREITTDSVAARVRALDPDVALLRQPYRSGWSGSLLGARLPGPAVPVLLLSALATLYLLVNGPQPWRATRWAWFWLLPVPFAVLAFCLLSGPTPGVRAPRTDRRLTGGWAFLIGSALGGAGSFAS